MPRGIYPRKKRVAKKSAVKKAVRKTRRPQGRVVETDEIPSISRSALRSSVSPTRSPPAAHALVTRVTPASPFDGVLEEQSFCLVNGDDELVDAGFDTFDKALVTARSEIEDAVESNEQDYTIDIYQRVARVEGEVPEEVKAKITVKAVAGSPV